MRDDNKNLLLALILSGLVLFAWQFFVAAPQVEQQRRVQQAQQAAPGGTQPNTVPGQPPSPSQAGGLNPPVPGTVPPAAVPAVETREAALGRSPRVRIDTPSLFGSIALKGGRIDDVALKNYRETVDPAAQHRAALARRLAEPLHRRVRLGRRAAGSAGPTRCGRRTSRRPSARHPHYDNGQGLVFRRTITSSESMFRSRTR
jgi:YidC/Oxa1 family membrane protein insertase